MRLITLEVQAFGPFRDKQLIDFSEVSQDGSFLLTGPSGSGKTSILDAMFFALYGKLPGNKEEVDKKRLKSTFADEDVTPYVELIFEHLGKKYKVYRQPAHEVLKKRGAGKRVQATEAQLNIYDDNGWGEALTAKARDTDMEMQKILSLTADQFSQIILLPQGRFDAFLKAKPDERKTVLKQIFPVYTYEQIQEWFDQERITAKQKTEKVLKQWQRLVDQSRVIYKQLAQYYLPEDSEIEFSEVENAEQTVVILNEVTKISDYAKTQITEEFAKSDTNYQTATNKYAEAEAIVERRKLLDEVNKLQTKIVELKPSVKVKEIALEKHNKANQVKVTITNKDNAKQKAKNAKLALDKELTVARKNSSFTEQETIDDYQKEIDELTLETVKLKVALQELKELDKAETELEKMNTEKYQYIASLLVVKDKTTSKVSQAKATFNEAKANHQDMELKLKGLRALQREQRAALLASDLEDTEPCPVCGSLEHPKLAMWNATEELVQDEKLEQEERKVDKAEKQIDIAKDELVKVEAKLKEVETGISEVSETDLEIAKASSIAKVSVNSSVSTLIKKVRSCIMQYEEELKQVNQRRTKLAENLTVQDYKKQINDNDNLGNTYKKLVRVLRNNEQAKSNYDEAQQAVAVALEKHGFNSEVDVASMLLDTQTEHNYKVSISDFDRKKGALEIKTNDDNYEKAVAEFEAKVTVPDAATVDTLFNDYQELKLIRENLAVSKQSITQIAKQTISVKEKFDSSRSKNQKVIEDAFALETLANTINGRGSENTRSMDLLTYVLAAKLEQVIEFASDHLRKMSERYEFRYTDEREPGRGRKTGMGIEIYDDFNSEVRQTVSLSGGETFMASLSLALGLADVIKHETGGVELDTLFIDEGFGSLDSQALDSVMDTLEKLKEEGRTLCLISHVEEMKQRIPQQIELVKTREGSGIRINI
ncbi:MAG: SMC family ATPase [Micrococcaceae bacterium]